MFMGAYLWALVAIHVLFFFFFFFANVFQPSDPFLLVFKFFLLLSLRVLCIIFISFYHVQSLQMISPGLELVFQTF